MPEIIQPTSPHDFDLRDAPEMEILAHVDDLWKVRVFLPFQEASQRQLLIRLREIKFRISQEYDIPTSLLEFRDLVEKTPVEGGTYAVIIVGMKEVMRGKPRIRLRPLETPRGELIPDMIAELDFNYLDEFDHPITIERIKVELKKHNIAWAACDIEKLEEAMRQVHNAHGAVQGLVIARGNLPDTGQDAVLEYTFLTDREHADNMVEYRAARKVKEGDILCRKIPPKTGKKYGKDVHGGVISPIKGLDFDLVAGEGARLSLDGTVLKALRDGVPFMKRKTRKIYTLAGEKIVPEKIEVSVKPLISLKGNEETAVLLEEPVEITGDLKSGFSVSTDGEVFIAGDMEPGASVSSKDKVTIEGSMRGGEITSEKSVYAHRDVVDAKIIAGDEIVILGLVQNAELSARDVKAEHVAGSDVEAGRKLSIRSIADGSDGRRSKIKLGRKEYYQQQLDYQRQEVDDIEKNLTRIREIFGAELLNQLDESNQHRLLMQYIRMLTTRGKSQIDNTAIESFRKLLESFNPLQDVMEEKLEEMGQLKKKAEEENSQRPIVVIREKIDSDVKVTIRDKTQIVKARKGGVAITTDKNSEIATYALKPPSHKRKKKAKSEV